MKISKLFHWLYAILMLLPFAFFVPSVLYYAFNDNATMQSVEVPQTETIAVDFNQQLEPIDSVINYTNLTYTISNDYDLILNGTASNSDLWVNGGYNSTEVLFTLKSGHQYLAKNMTLYSYTSVGLYFDTWDSTKILIPNSDYPITGIRAGWISGKVFDNYIWHLNLFDLTQMYGAGNEPDKYEFADLWGANYPYPYTESELMQITYETGTTEQLVENTSIINYAWESIWDLPLFSWTKVTFVSVPFSYLTGIFGIGASNSLNYVFGYFVTISIVWLVFDLLLYVPMLAHNWIDKARIE